MYKKISLFLGISSLLFSHPNNGQFIIGKGSFSLNENDLTIKTQSQNSIIEWESFSLAENESAHFIQPSVNAAILNRVNGNQCSEILGKINSNGKVYLLNPNGILIGPKSKISTSAFLATTLDTSNDDFLKAEKLPLFGTSVKTILNFGKITALRGDVFLVAYEVENHGTIEALGEVGLVSAKYFITNSKGKEKIWIKSFDVSESCSLSSLKNNHLSLHTQNGRAFLVNTCSH